MDEYIHCVACVFVRTYMCIFGLQCMCLCVRALSFMRWVRFYEEETSKALKAVNVGTGLLSAGGCASRVILGVLG